MKPVHDVHDCGTGFKIFKYEGDRHARPPEHPGSAYLAGNALHSRTLRPVKRCHAILLSCNSIWALAASFPAKKIHLSRLLPGGNSSTCGRTSTPAAGGLPAIGPAERKC